MRILAVTNMYPTADRPFQGTFVEQQVLGLRAIGVDVVVHAVDRASLGMSAYWGLGRRIRHDVRLHGPDLVHVMYGGVMADLVTRAVDDVPVVVSFCGSDLLGEPLGRWWRRLLAGIGVRASWRAARRSAGIIVKSRNLQEALPADLAPSRVHIIPNGVDLDRFRPLDQNECRARLGWKPGVFHVVFSANHGDAVKRPALARASVEHLARTGVVVEFHMLSGIAHVDVPIWLNAADVLLLTSQHEGSPNIVKEALACNLPVISVDVGDVAERIAGIDGCYLAESDPTDLAAKLVQAYQGQRRVQGRQKMQSLSLGCIAKPLIRFYEELLDSWKSRSVPS